MTCRHVLDLIDAGPFVDVAPAQLDAAREHARQCATCGPAFAAATALTADLGALPQPAPPRELAATVMARIARIEPAAAPVLSRWRERSAWATALAGLGAGLTIVLLASFGGALPAVRGITAGLAAMPATTTGAMLLTVGLVLYLAGLFVALGERSRS